FSGFVAVGEDADVAAVGDGDACCQSRFDAGPLCLKPFRLGVAFFPTTIDSHRLASRDGGAKGYPSVGHQAKHLFIAFIAMLDGLDASQGGSTHALSRGGVSRHGTTG